MSRLKDLIREIHRRSLWQVLLIYCGAALVAYQAVQALTEGLGLPQWFPAFAIVLFIVGLPIVLATAFVHEVSPPTVKPAEAEAAGIGSEAAPVQLETGRRDRFLTWRNAAATFVIVLAAWGVVATGWYVIHGRAPVPTAERKSVAVLPFANLSADPENEFFSDGVTVEIIDRLSKIADLTVKSRTSSFQYKDTDKSLREIGDELGVSAIVEGEVRRVGDRVRVNAQLIDADTDEHLWAEQYDRQLTDIFSIQSDVAQQIATALKATLTADEKRRLEQRPTENIEAYEYYLRGTAHFRRRQLEREYHLAVQMHETAVGLDPGFAEAWAAIARVRVRLYFVYGRASELPEVEAAVDVALNLAPDLSEVQMAVGDYYYYGRRDYDRALEHYAIVLSQEPHNAQALASTAWIRRRQGNWQAAVAGLMGALEFDPRHDTYLFTLGDTHLLMRQYQEAERYYNRAVSLAPDLPLGHLGKVWISLSRDGDRRSARQVLGEAAQMIDPEELLLSAELGRSLVPLALVRIFPDYFAQVLDGMAPATFGRDSAYYFLARAHLSRAREETLATHAYYDSARAVLEPSVQEWPNEYRPHALLGLAYAGLGRTRDAIRHGQKAVGLLPVSRDARNGPSLVWSLAEIEVTVGDYDSAIGRLDLLLSIPSEISVPVLRMDPIWDPLRDHPSFQALLEKYE
jgi:serine/threonine-protein kinase